MNEIVFFILGVAVIGLSITLLGRRHASKSRGLNLLRLSLYLTLFLSYKATMNTALVYIICIACISDIFLTILYYEKKIEEEG